MARYILAIDQGTTSSRVVLFNEEAQIISIDQKPFEQHFPQDGWVEHDAMGIWQDVLFLCRAVLSKVNVNEISALGITNQRETTVIWDRYTGVPVYKAIVWQDRRGVSYCESYRKQSLEPLIQKKTGLLLDPYFSATKIKWLLDQIPGLRQRAEQGSVLFGTMDTFLLWHLTGGTVHATDASNASRTLLFNIHTQSWDDELLALFNIPRTLLPTVKNCSDFFGETDPSLFGSTLPILGVAGDQQAATIGQACFKAGMAKCTYGTGAFLVLNVGEKAVISKQNLLTTVAYRFNDQVTYAMEGSIFVAGAAMQWLRDNIHFFAHSKDSEALARSVSSTDGVYFIPAFTGLGAPFWNPHVRGAILGLTRDSNIAHITRAALEAVCYQTRALLEAMRKDGALGYSELRVDGGMVANDWFCEFLADVLNIPVVRPKIIETTVLGVAYCAGLKAGLWSSLSEVAAFWQKDRIFEPKMQASKREELYAGWLTAVNLLF